MFKEAVLHERGRLWCGVYVHKRKPEVISVSEKERRKRQKKDDWAGQSLTEKPDGLSLFNFNLVITFYRWLVLLLCAIC